MQIVSYLLLAASAVVLAAGPVHWLIGTWTQPGYPAYPVLVAALVAVLFAWSLSSPRSAFSDPQKGRRMALALLLGTLVVRLASQLLAVNVVGAFALAVDVYALGLLAGLGDRRRRVSPGWLATLFLFCLPVEPIFQRSVGYLLQHASAAGACALLGAVTPSVECSGARIVLMGREVLVDLPCSGARLLTTLSMSFALLCALTSPRAGSAFGGLLVTFASAWVANVLRIFVLALGIAFAEPIQVDVMSAPWHELIGLVALAGGLAPLLLWSRFSASAATDFSAGGHASSLLAPLARMERQRTLRRLLMAGAAFGVALGIVQLSPRPVDVSGSVPPPMQPTNLAGYPAAAGPLSAREREYFTRYGGTARRATYGPFGLLLVRTTSPLRHLHAPDACLEGAGHQVRYLTARFAGVPTAVYRSVAPDGRAYQVRVTFVSARGRVATSVSEVVWHWLQAPDEAWTMVQRIAPVELSGGAFERWDASVAQAYDLGHPASELAGTPVKLEI